MRMSFCIACGDRDPNHLEHHHLVPREDGGTDDETNLVTLCCECHGKAHGIRRRNGLRRLTRMSRERATSEGVKFGRPSALSKEQGEEARRRVTAGEPQSFVAKSLGVSQATISRVVNR
jgi:hypothetical protein